MNLAGVILYTIFAVAASGYATWALATVRGQFDRFSPLWWFCYGGVAAAGAMCWLTVAYHWGQVLRG